MRVFPKLHTRPLVCLGALALAAATVSGAGDEKKKPSLNIRATPVSGFAPLKVSVSVTLQGGANDYQEYYCPAIEWDWDDGTKSQEKIDCDPYEAGKSEIRRRFTAEHTYRQAGSYKVYFRLKQKSKTVGAGSANVRIRPGIREQTGG